jgi:hypothetical protein
VTLATSPLVQLRLEGQSGHLPIRLPSGLLTTQYYSSPAPPVPPKKRSHSQDNVLQAAAAAEKARAAKGGKSSKKGGLHVDVIDRLDYSGVGPASELSSLPLTVSGSLYIAPPRR